MINNIMRAIHASVHDSCPNEEPIPWEELYRNPTNWGLGAIFLAILGTNIRFKKKS